MPFWYQKWNWHSAAWFASVYQHLHIPGIAIDGIWRIVWLGEFIQKNRWELYGLFIVGSYKYKFKIYFSHILNFLKHFVNFFCSFEHVCIYMTHIQCVIYDYIVFTWRPKFRYSIFFWWYLLVIFFAEYSCD